MKLLQFIEIYKILYQNRFECFFITQLSILFGSLLFPTILFQETILPILFLGNMLAGILLISENKRKLWVFIFFFVGLLCVFGWDTLQSKTTNLQFQLQLGFYFMFYVAVTLDIMRQIWEAKTVSKNVIIGLMSGYISLGLIAFFLFITIEILTPGSFEGALLNDASLDAKIDSLLYYSYITLLTIGYGDIIPLTAVAQKASILVGLLGEFYIVIITAIVVGKYIHHFNKTKKI